MELIVNSKPRKNLRYQDVIAITDTREKLQLDLSPLETEVKGLKVGDYSVLGMEDEIAIERKSLGDLIVCVTHERERFDRNIEKLKKYKYKAIVVEADWCAIDMKQYRSVVEPAAVYGSLMGWALYDISIIFAGDRIRAGKMVARLLWVAANRINRDRLKAQECMTLESLSSVLAIT